MRTNKVLIIIIVVLVIVNLATLTFLWQGKASRSKYKRHNKVERYLDKRLALTGEQQEAFHHLREEHFANTKELTAQLNQSRKSLAWLLGDTASQRSIDSVMSSINNLNAQLEKQNFNHLNKLRSQLSPEQKQNFDSVVVKMIEKGHRHRRYKKK